MSIQKEINFDTARAGTIAGRRGVPLATLTFQLANGALRLWRDYQDRRLHRRDMKRLQGLSDYYLRDIGLTRDDLGKPYRHDRWTVR